MRSNHDPYPQHGQAHLDAQLEQFTVEVAQAVAVLEKLATSSIPRIEAALRHHTAHRATVKATIASNKNSLYRAYVACTGDLSQAFTATMADIETQRAVYHAKEKAAAEKERAAALAAHTAYHGGSHNR